MPGRPHRESDFIQVLMSHPTILFMSESTHLYGEEKPLQDQSHCTLWHGLRNLHGVSPERKTVTREGIHRTGSVTGMHNLCLQAGTWQVPSRMCRVPV